MFWPKNTENYRTYNLEESLAMELYNLMVHIKTTYMQQSVTFALLKEPRFIFPVVSPLQAAVLQIQTDISTKIKDGCIYEQSDSW